MILTEIHKALTELQERICEPVSLNARLDAAGTGPSWLNLGLRTKSGWQAVFAFQPAEWTDNPDPFGGICDRLGEAILRSRILPGRSNDRGSNKP
jgi:hypothetical protein